MADRHEALLGEFVNLRPLVGEDAELTHRWRLADPSTALGRNAASVEEQRNWIETRPDDEYNYVMESKSHQPLGTLALTHVDFHNGRAESARFILGEKQAARGLPVAVEGMKLLYELAFERLGLRRVYGTVAANNPRMVKWQKFLGMQSEGVLRGHYWLDGKPLDAVCLGILAEEYRQVARPRMEILIAAARSAG